MFLENTTLLFWIELFCTLTGIAFIVLLIANKLIAWPFGIISSALGAYLFYQNNLYAEMTTYTIYVVLGFYGWWYWSSANLKTQAQEKATRPITEWVISHHLVLIFLGLISSFIVGYALKLYTNSQMVYFDAFTSVFALIATLLEARKVRSSWLYWIVINLFTILLYLLRDLNGLSFLMVVYTVLSVVGYIKWNKLYKAQLIEN